jgi:FkbM family methyltransferase
VPPVAARLSPPALPVSPASSSKFFPRRLVRRAVDRIAARLGFELIPAWRAKTLEQSRHLGSLLAKLQVDVALDVGANVGGFRDLLRSHVGFKGRIISFEPVPEVYEVLTAAAGDDPLWQGARIALGDGEGALQMNITQRSTMSSFLARDEAMLRRHGYGHLLDVTEITRTEVVPLRTLDSMYDELFGARNNPRIFLKCDTQGYDLKVIAGAADTLRSVLALQIELSIRPIYEGAPRYVEVLEHLSGLGFDVTGVFPVRRDELSRIVNFDCVMVNSRHPFVQQLVATTVRGRTPG